MLFNNENCVRLRRRMRAMTKNRFGSILDLSVNLPSARVAPPSFDDIYIYIKHAFRNVNIFKNHA